MNRTDRTCGPRDHPKAAGGAEGSGDTGKRQILSKGELENLWILGDSLEWWGLAWEAN